MIRRVSRNREVDDLVRFVPVELVEFGLEERGVGLILPDTGTKRPQITKLTTR